MKLLELKIPPPIVTFVFALVIWGISATTLRLEINSNIRLISSLIALGSGMFFAAAGWISFRNAKTTISPLKPENTTSLVRSGIYSISRNPMYVGLALILVSWWIYLSAPFGFAGVLGFIMYTNKFQIYPEEYALKQIFGSEFDDYVSTTRRWL